ncbi:MAG: GIY-YIG nuclease family protein [Acidiferrobacterales bacterium]
MTRPQTIQIFLPAGDPQGIRVAEITTRIVRVIEVPRSLLAEFLKMPEAQQVGVYYLVGPAEEGEGALLYIGQSGAVGSRLAQHNENKDFWNRALVVVSLTDSLTQTHVLFLEWLGSRMPGTPGAMHWRTGIAGPSRTHRRRLKQIVMKSRKLCVSFSPPWAILSLRRSADPRPGRARRNSFVARTERKGGACIQRKDLSC